MSKIITAENLLEVLNAKRKGTIREAREGEEPHFVREKNKMCTGMSGRLKDGTPYTFMLNQPILLKAGIGYVIELEPLGDKEG